MNRNLKLINIKIKTIFIKKLINLYSTKKEKILAKIQDDFVVFGTLPRGPVDRNHEKCTNLST